MSGPFEMAGIEPPMIPTVFEIADVAPLFAAPLSERFTDAELMAFVFDGSEIPQVPLSGSAVYLALGLALLIRRRRRA